MGLDDGGLCRRGLVRWPVGVISGFPKLNPFCTGRHQFDFVCSIFPLFGKVYKNKQLSPNFLLILLESNNIELLTSSTIQKYVLT